MGDEKLKFILDIVPLTKIPLVRNQSFCYISEEKLPAGTLVSIPLFRRNVEGIVVGNRPDFKRRGGIHLKKIEKIVKKGLLTPNQLKLAQFISDYYISSLGVVMKGFVPKRVKAKNIGCAAWSIKKKDIILTEKQSSAIGKIINWKTKIGNGKFLLHGPASSGKTEIYIHAIAKLKARDPKLQFLILLPEKTLTPQALERYGMHFKPEEIAVLSSNISKGHFYSGWERIKSGEVKIIIGTRMAVFAPFNKLGLVVVDEEQDMSYKQWDMNPRYDARYVAEKLAEMHKCPVVFGSATPSLEAFYKTAENKYPLIKLPPLPVQNSKFKIQNSSTVIVDMRLERLSKNNSCISKKLRSEIAYALKNNLQVILFINRQGMSSFSVCESCKAVLRCPRCDRAVIYNNSGQYKCVHCSYKTSIIPFCPKCKGIIFKNVGLGTQKVEQEIVDFFPNAKVARIDSQSIKNSKNQEKIYKDFSQGKIDILVGTQMISKGWDLPSVSLVGIIDTDNMLSIPDFSGSARFFQNIVQVSGRVSRLGAKFPGVVVLQTYQPENKLIKIATEKNWEKFFETETAERKALDLPPFSKIIKLVFQDYSFKKTETEANRIHELLKKINDILLSEPGNCYVPKIRGRFRRQLIIKYKEDIPYQLRKILSELGTGWIIDVDPISIA